jgi:hypothetical protein
VKWLKSCKARIWDQAISRDLAAQYGAIAGMNGGVTPMFTVVTPTIQREQDREKLFAGWREHGILVSEHQGSWMLVFPPGTNRAEILPRMSYYAEYLVQLPDKWFVIMRDYGLPDGRQYVAVSYPVEKYNPLPCYIGEWQNA